MADELLSLDAIAPAAPAAGELLSLDAVEGKARNDRSHIGASAIAGGRTLLAAGARVLDQINPFTTTDEEAAVLYKDNPEKFKQFTEHSASAVLSRFAQEQTARAKSVMQEVRPDEKGAISGKNLSELEYATLDPEKAAYLSPTRVAGDVLQSLPTTLALAVTGYLTKGRSVAAAQEAEAAALARGASAIEAKEAAKQAAITTGADTMAKVGAASEGTAGFATQYDQALADAKDIKPEVYEKSPEYQALIAQGYTPETARAKLQGKVAKEAGLIAGAVDAGTSAVGGHFLGKIIGEGGSLVGRTARGMGTEALTEAPQSAGEQFGQNLAMRSINPDQSLSEGVGEAAAAGLVVGGVTGGGTASVFGSRQRDQDVKAAAEQTLSSAPDVATAIKAADQLAGDIHTLESHVNDYLDAGGQIPTPAQALAQPAAGSPELRGMVDRNAENIGKANAAGFEADRQNALAQAEAALPEPKPRTAADYADLTPMNRQQAEARLAVLRDMTAREGGNSLELAVVPHPGGNPERFAIGKQALPSLDIAEAPKPVSQQEAQHRIETAALTGKVGQAKAEDQNSRQVVIDRALRNVEDRGGVASPAEAKIFQEAGLGKPYDRIDTNLGPALSTDEQLTQATGIPLEKTARESGSENQRVANLQQLNNQSMAEQEARAQANQNQANRLTEEQIAKANEPAPVPVNAAIEALATQGSQRSAEQNLAIRQAEQRLSPADFSIVQRAATAPFQLNTEERSRLKALRAGPTQSVVNTQQTRENTYLMGERVRAALAQPTNGNIVTTGAKLSSTRAAPTGTVTINDNGVDHTVTLADVTSLGDTGRLVQQIARIFGKRVQAFSSDSLKADGFVQDDDNKTIYLNKSSTVSPLAVFGHELLHLLKRDNPVAYRALATVVARNMDAKGRADFRGYYGKGADIEEMTADLMGNQFQDPAFWSDVFAEIGVQAGDQATGVINRLAAAMNKAVSSFMKVVQQGGFKSDEFVKDVDAVKAAIKQAVTQYAQQQKIPAMQMEAEQAKVTSQINMNAGSSPSITASQRRADFTHPEERQEVSTTRPKPAPKKGRLSNSYDEKWVIDSQDVKGSETHVAAVLRAIGEYNTLTGKGDASQRLQELHDVVVDNLLWLHDLVPKDVRERAKLWYDGANRIATDWTSKYGISVRQSSGVLAVLSPQMDWFKNVSLGERVISIYKERQNETWSPAMTAWFQSWVNAAKDVDTKASRQAYLDQVRPLEGVKLADMDDRQAAFFVRAFDEAYYERQYRLVTPEGGFGEYVTNSDDGDAAVTWGGFDSIEKAVSILNDGSFRNIDNQLGDEHKVRNFYNNIINPGSADGHVTIDTHAVAAALVKALSGSSMEVSHNFGSTAKGAPGAGGNVETGASGTYGLFADAYRDAAAKRKLLPREMQSITWEAVRALFPASIKDQLAPKVDAIWNRFKKGELTREQARDEVRELAGGVRKMAWEGSDEGKFPAAGGTSFNTEIDADVNKRTARTLPPEVAKDKISVTLSPNTNSIPGVAALQAAAAKGDAMAHQLLQDVGLDNLRHLLEGTSARIKADGATGLYGGYVETSLSMQVSFADNDRAQVLAALAKFAENFNQEQIHVRRGTKAKAGTAFADGSYATPVYRWDLKEALTRKQIEKVIEKSGLYGLTFGDDFVEAYYVGDPADEQAIEQFFANATIADGLLGKAGGQVSRTVAQLWPYGQGDGAIGYDRIRGDISAGPATSSTTAKRVAQYLNSGAKVKSFEQAAEITPEQDKLQGKIAQVYESLPDNDLKNPNVRKAYTELAKEVIRQFKALPIKVEVMNGQGEPYPNSAAMRRDILDNNHLYIFGTTPETFGPAGEDFTGHPLLENTGLKDQNGYPLLYNDLLRAVHDYYAHAMTPTQFGAKGEEAAWKNHMAMTPNMWARWALTAETRGQNSWVNFRPDLDRSTPAADRPFARQKAVLLPVEYSLTGDRTVDKPMKEFIDKLGDRVKQGTKPVKEAKLSRQRDAEAEYAAVEAQYKGTPEWLKAPNGNDTNLTERQWVQVRTPSFKNWFGDWEKYATMKGGVWNDGNEEVSKVVDANGEPLVVYHGSNKAGFSVFKRPGGTGRGDLGIFATPNLEMAKTYMTRRAGEVQIENDPLRPRQPSRQERTQGYYASFMNLRNPQESDFEGATWNGERPGQYQVMADDELQYTPEGKAYFDNFDDANEFAKTVDGEVLPAFEHYETTDAVVAEARQYSDGVIIHNVVDDGGGVQNMYAGEPSDVYVAFDPNQIKSATQNTGEFSSENDDIRYSKQRIVGDSKRQYTPAQKAMFERTGRTVEVPTIKERIAELRKDFGKKLAQGIADQFAPLKDLSKQAYTLARLSKGTPGAVEAFLHHGKLKLTDNVYDADQTGGFIERVGVPLHGELEDFMWWVAANRAERLAAEDREHLFTPEDIAAGKSLDNGTTNYDYTLQHGPNAGKTTRDRTLIYRDALKTFEEFNRNAMDMAAQSGLIDEESRKYWEHQFYVPFYRVSEEDGGFVGAKLSNKLVRQRAFKELKGGTDKLNSDLLANTLQNWAHLIDAAAKNRAAKASLEAAQNVGVAVEADEATVRSMSKAMGMKKNVVWFMDQGKERYFLVDDPYVMAAISSLEYSGMKGPLMDGLSTFKHWLTVGVTASPVFKVKNLVRDSLQAVATAPLSYNIAGNIKEGIKASDRSSQTYVSALASGGLIRFGTMLENRASDRVRQLIKSGVKDSTILDTESKVQAFYDKVLEPAVVAYNELGNRGEEINRSALYSQLMKQGMSHAEASLMARDLMDFSMQGTWTTIRFLTQVVPFMNARIQGLYKLGRAAKEDKARFAIVLGATALASLALMAAYSDDDDWKKREDWDRNGNWWFKIGGIAYRIPKPFEIGAIATLAERGVEYFTDKEMTGKRLGKNVMAILKDNLSMNPIPQAVKPIMDVYANKDSFTGRPIETMGMERLEPQRRYTANTSMVARGLSTATGGAASPVQIDHLLHGYFSWLGSFVVGGADMALRPLSGEASRPTADYWKLASGGMLSELPAPQSRYVTHMYDQAVELEQAMGTYKSLLKEGKTAEAREYLQEHKAELRKYGAVEKVKAAETRYNERIRMIERSKMSPDEKKAQIQKIQQLKDKVARLVY